jgi:hypothetical protein
MINNSPSDPATRLVPAEPGVREWLQSLDPDKLKESAYAFRSGLIGFCENVRSIPAGALPLARHPRGVLRATISALARRGYDGSLLVPGVPEATTSADALDALCRFAQECKMHFKALEVQNG